MVRSLKQCMLVGALVVFVAAVAWAAANATGKWGWKQAGQNGNETAWTMELKQDGEKLTGTLLREGADMKNEISEGKIKDADLSFNVVREFNGNKVTAIYKGKIDGDTIKGNIITNFGGQERTREWTATRAK